MNTQVFITGQSRIPMTLKKDPTLTCTLIENPYDLRSALGSDESDKIVVVFLPFLEVRHFDLYSFLQKSIKNVKIFFVVNELSSNMKIRLKHNNDFVVLWKTEENNLPKDIHAYLDGRQLELRQDKRETQDTRAMLSPSMLPLGVENRGFQPILGGSFENISLNGSCLKIKAPFYTKKDFINLTYQNKQGEYVSVEGQVRWSKWNETEQSQELGVQFLTQA
ncbi:PilZ domain-containing protein [Bdellovibrio bacteriovorus]|uniref:PilZ domain-containing protein n=1 Tax=Bdellovibrio bacteriovorus TaxID=959 RepID=UPI0035A610AA